MQASPGKIYKFSKHKEYYFIFNRKRENNKYSVIFTIGKNFNLGFCTVLWFYYFCLTRVGVYLLFLWIFPTGQGLLGGGSYWFKVKFEEHSDYTLKTFSLTIVVNIDGQSNAIFSQQYQYSYRGSNDPTMQRLSCKFQFNSVRFYQPIIGLLFFFYN